MFIYHRVTTSFIHPNSPWRMVKISAGRPKRRSGPRTLLNPAWAAQVRKKLVWCRMLVLGLIPSKYTHSSQKITTRFTPHMGITTIVVQNGQMSHWTFRDHTNFRWATPSATVPRIWSRQKGPKTPYAFPRRTRANLVHGQSLNTALVHFSVGARSLSWLDPFKDNKHVSNHIHIHLIPLNAN